MSSGHVINNLRLGFLCIVVMNFKWKNELLLSLTSYISKKREKKKKTTKELTSGITRMGLQWFLFESEN